MAARGNIVDRVVGFFSPAAGARRAAIRSFLDSGRFSASGGYRGARSTRLNYNWATGQESADAAYDGELQTLRDKSRDLNRNNEIAAGITDTICVNTIHTGIKPQSRIRAADCGISEEQAEAYQAMAERAWERWMPHASACGRMNFYEIQLLAARQIIESGEFLAVRRAIKEPFRPYYLALDCIEPDRLDDPAGRTDGGRRYGIDQNEHGRPLAYHIRKTHPGDSFYPKKDGNEYVKVPAMDRDGRPLVFHVFPILRPGQTRGVPFFAPVIEKFKIMADYIDATVVAARVAACFAVFVTGVQSPFQAAVGRKDTTDDNSNRLETIEPGIIEYLSAGREVHFAKPEQPTTTFSEFSERLLRMIGASLNLPYELVLNDFSKTNYSSARAALLQAYRVFSRWQAMIRDHLCQPVWNLLMEEAWLRGELPAPGFRRRQWDYSRAEWIPPGWMSVDPEKEAKASEIELRLGSQTLADTCAKRGENWEDKIKQAGRERKAREKEGLNPEPWSKNGDQKTGDQGRQNQEGNDDES
jgi:lambda family phage portal protein